MEENKSFLIGEMIIFMQAKLLLSIDHKFLRQKKKNSEQVGVAWMAEHSLSSTYFH